VDLCKVPGIGPESGNGGRKYRDQNLIPPKNSHFASLKLLPPRFMTNDSPSVAGKEANQKLAFILVKWWFRIP
jgi:hypothetical protein